MTKDGLPITVVSWSSGKDCAFALHQLRSQNLGEVVGLLTTLNEENDRVAMHGVRRQLLVQFLIENYIICFLALMVAIVGAYFLVPAYSSLWEYMTIILSFTEHWSFWIFLILLLLVTGLSWRTILRKPLIKHWAQSLLLGRWRLPVRCQHQTCRIQRIWEWRL